MEREHSLLNPSSSDIWLTCTPAPRFSEHFVKLTSDYADEGTLCHSIATDLVAYRLKRLSKRIYLKRLAEYKLHRLYNPEMDHYSEGFANYVLEIYYGYRLKGWASIWIETRIDYDHIAPDGYGHLDIAIISPGQLDIIDLKYGKGVPVSAIENAQLKLYAVGVIDATRFIEQSRKVKLHIYQPRIDNISVYDSTTKKIEDWAENEVREKAQLAHKGDGDFVAGSHCRFCPAWVKCKAATDYYTDMAKHDFKLPYELGLEEIAEILHKGEQLITWYTSVKDYATAEARKGVKFDGFKLVPGKSNRRFKAGSEILVGKALIKAGYRESDFLEPRTLMGIGKLESLLGKDGFERKLGKFIEKPPGAPTLVPITDKRHAINGVESAHEDFKNVNVKTKK